MVGRVGRVLTVENSGKVWQGAPFLAKPKFNLVTSMKPAGIILGKDEVHKTCCYLLSGRRWQNMAKQMPPNRNSPVNQSFLMTLKSEFACVQHFTQRARQKQQSEFC